MCLNAAVHAFLDYLPTGIACGLPCCLPLLISVEMYGLSFPTTVSNAMVRTRSTGWPVFGSIPKKAHSPIHGMDRLIVPGDPGKSLLFERINHPEKARKMPPPMSDRELTPKQVDVVRRWIEEGAKWQTHWAFTAPHRPELPAVKDTGALRNPIDHFIQARLEREGLVPSAEADRRTLLRRLSFDLTGLPPTLEEVDAFVKDKSPDAYEKQVDRLLSSPHYGERMAMDWLDVARYADTHGFHIDSHRDMWPWRDWLIKAFNSNMSFDKFTTLQLAGDLLPDAGVEGKIASGFNRNHMINFEGGAIPEEYLVEYVADRAETTSNAWMGLTMGCARCHTHKYDPISHKEYYQFFAFFNSVDEKGLDGRTGNAKPLLNLPTPAQEETEKELAAGIKTREAALDAKEVNDAMARWRETLTGKSAPISREGLSAHYDFDGSLNDISGKYQHGRTVKGDPGFGPGQVSRSVAFDGQTLVTLGQVGASANPAAVYDCILASLRGRQTADADLREDRVRPIAARLGDVAR